MTRARLFSRCARDTPQPTSVLRSQVRSTGPAASKGARVRSRRRTGAASPGLGEARPAGARRPRYLPLFFAIAHQLTPARRVCLCRVHLGCCTLSASSSPVPIRSVHTSTAPLAPVYWNSRRCATSSFSSPPSRTASRPPSEILPRLTTGKTLCVQCVASSFF